MLPIIKSLDEMYPNPDQDKDMAHYKQSLQRAALMGMLDLYSAFNVMVTDLGEIEKLSKERPDYMEALGAVFSKMLIEYDKIVGSFKELGIDLSEIQEEDEEEN